MTTSPRGCLPFPGKGSVTINQLREKCGNKDGPGEVCAAPKWRSPGDWSLSLGSNVSISSEICNTKSKKDAFNSAVICKFMACPSLLLRREENKWCSLKNSAPRLYTNVEFLKFDGARDFIRHTKIMSEFWLLCCLADLFVFRPNWIQSNGTGENIGLFLS